MEHHDITHAAHVPVPGVLKGSPLRPHPPGGHSIDSPEPIFGLVVAGIAHPDHIRANSTARPGDVLVLTKPLGVGAMTTAVKKGKLDQAGYKEVRPGHTPDCGTVLRRQVQYLASDVSYKAECFWRGVSRGCRVGAGLSGDALVLATPLLSGTWS